MNKYEFKYEIKTPKKHYSCIVETPVTKFEIDEDAKFLNCTKGNVVYGFSMVNNTMPYIPKNFGNFFPKMKAIQIKNSSLEEISSENFVKLRNLELVDLSYNEIQFLEGDPFQHNSQLSTIDFSNNKIFAIGPNVFANLKQNDRNIKIELNTCFSSTISKSNWIKGIESLNNLCWSSSKIMDINVLKNTRSIQRLKRSNKSSNEGMGNELQSFLDFFLKNLTQFKPQNDWNSAIANLNATLLGIDKNVNELRDIEKVFSNTTNKNNDELKKDINKINSDLSTNFSTNEKKIDDIKTQFNTINDKINEIASTIDDLSNKINNTMKGMIIEILNSSKNDNKSKKNLKNSDNENGNQQVNNERNLTIIEYVNTALLILLIIIVLIFKCFDKKRKSPENPQYDKIKRVPSRVNSKIKSQREPAISSTSFGSLRRENSENLVDKNGYLHELAQQDTHKDSQNNYNQDYSELMYETAQWNESSKQSHLESHPQINESISAALSNDDFYAEIPAQVKVVDLQAGEEKEDSEIYAVITNP